MKSRKSRKTSGTRKKKVYRRTDDEWEDSSDVYDTECSSSSSDDDDDDDDEDDSAPSASETEEYGESSWTPTILAEEMRYREKGMEADESEIMKEESYDEVDMLLMGFEQGLDERFAGALAFKKTNDMCTRKTWALFLATWMAAVFGIDAPNRLWRAWSILLSASFLMVTVFQIHSLIAEFNDIKYGTILLLAMLWFLLVTLASATFSLRMWKHKGWLFGTWRLLWESEHCVKGSARRLSFIIPLILLAVVGNSLIITAARWVNIEEVANKVFRELLVSRYALVQALFSLIWVAATGAFLLPLALFFDMCRVVSHRIRRQHYAVVHDIRSLPQLVDDFNHLSSHLMVVNRVFGPWITVVFAIQVPLIVICLVALLNVASLDGLTITVIVSWATSNLILTIAVALVSAKIHADAESMIHKIALHVRSGRDARHRSDFMFFSTSIQAHSLGIRVAGSIIITYRVIAKVISFAGSLYLLLVGFRTAGPESA